jgi:uncharacterized membrane protein
MWTLNFLPEIVIHLIFLLGVLGVITVFAIGFIPFFKIGRLPFQIISILLLSLGLYLEGGLAKKKDFDLKVKELEVKVAKAEAEAANKTVEIQEKIIEKTKVIKQKGETQIEFITKLEKGDTVTIVKDMSEEERKKFQAQIDELKKFNETCTIPSIVIDQHNKATQKPEGTKK